MQQLIKFRGDLGFIHDLEGHYASGLPYWPTGNSGVTLNPGIDLYHVDIDTVIDALPHLRPHLHYLEEWKAVRGQAAKAIMPQVTTQARDLRIIVNREQAEHALPLVMRQYWEDVAKRFPALMASGCPPCVQAVLLSLAYNRGPNNSGLKVLQDPLDSGDWVRVGKLVSAMQSTHKIIGVRNRRRAEGELILAAYPEHTEKPCGTSDGQTEVPNHTAQHEQFLEISKEFDITDEQTYWLVEIMQDPRGKRWQAYQRLYPHMPRSSCQDIARRWFRLTAVQNAYAHMLQEGFKHAVVTRNWVLDNLAQNVKQGREGRDVFDDEGQFLRREPPDLSASNGALKQLVSCLGMNNKLIDKAVDKWRRVAISMTHDEAQQAYRDNLRAGGENDD